MTLTPQEIERITGYRRPKEQLADLKKHGFVRARMRRDGKVILEKDHYVAICRGQFALSDSESHTGRPVPTPFRKAS
jgi:hypothetical protein